MPVVLVHVVVAASGEARAPITDISAAAANTTTGRWWNGPGIGTGLCTGGPASTAMRTDS